MDVARVLLTPAEALTNTDIAAHALQALAASRVTEVTILGRCAPAQAAFLYPEFMELGELPDVAIQVENDTSETGLLDSGHETALKLDGLKALCAECRDGCRRVVFRFRTTPEEILGEGRVEKIQIRSQTEGQFQTSELETGLVLAAIGYRGRTPAELRAAMTWARRLHSVRARSVAFSGLLSNRFRPRCTRGRTSTPHERGDEARAWTICTRQATTIYPGKGVCSSYTSGRIEPGLPYVWPIAGKAGPGRSRTRPRRDTQLTATLSFPWIPGRSPTARHAPR